uniref:ETX/MTX2 family pore-forming toxin n=1 Tax=Bacillus cereus TaxID=1396 RepID=UPI0018644DF1
NKPSTNTNGNSSTASTSNKPTTVASAWENYYNKPSTNTNGNSSTASTSNKPTTVASAWENYYNKPSTNTNTSATSDNKQRPKRETSGQDTNQNYQIEQPPAPSPNYKFIKKVYYVDKNKWVGLYQNTQNSEYYVYDARNYQSGTLNGDNFAKTSMTPNTNQNTEGSTIIAAAQQLPPQPSLQQVLMALHTTKDFKPEHVNIDSLSLKMQSVSPDVPTKVSEGNVKIDLGAHSTMINNSNRPETRVSGSMSQTITDSITVTNTYGFKIGGSYKYTASVPGVSSWELSFNTEFNYSNAKATATSNAITYTIPSQTIEIPANSKAVVTSYLTKTKYKGQMNIKAELEGNYEVYANNKQNGNLNAGITLQTTSAQAAQVLKQKGLYLTPYENKAMFEGKLPYEVENAGEFVTEVRYYSLAYPYQEVKPAEKLQSQKR